MRLFFCGDVVGRAGRDAVMQHLPALKQELSLDFIIVNGDNAAGGYGVTAALCKDFFQAGADLVTAGDHVWDQKELVPTLASEKRLLRPHNFPESAPGTGFGIYETAAGKKVAVLHLLGQVFHREYLDSPFTCAAKTLESLRMPGNVHAIVVDMHAEATSEKTAMGHYLDGKVSMVVGSHTHIPTADARILRKGTAYQTDAGMCGDYDSVIGFDAAAPMQRFLTKMPKIRLVPASGEGTLCGLFVETDDATGLARSVQPVRRGGMLATSS